MPSAQVLDRPTVEPGEPPSRPADRRLVVLFDGDCGLCRESVRTLRRWDRERRLEFVPLQEAAGSGRPLLERLAGRASLADALHVVDEASGEVMVGGAAALAILDALPGGWLLRPWAGLPPTELAADLLYRLVARHRETVAWVVGLPDEMGCPLPGGRDEAGAETGPAARSGAGRDQAGTEARPGRG